MVIAPLQLIAPVNAPVAQLKLSVPVPVVVPPEQIIRPS
jgi:hypothetical protein